MAVSSRELAAALTAALTPHLPPGVNLKADGGSIAVLTNDTEWSGSAAPTILDDLAQQELDDPDELLERITRSTLSGIQDAIAIATGQPWPAVAGQRSAMAEPGARVDDDTVHAWFGEAGDPLLRLNPFPV